MQAGASRREVSLTLFVKFLQTILAVLFLSLSWLWDRLAVPVRWIFERIPLEGLKRAVIRFMDRLPPYPTLFVFLIPIVILEPMKIVALWLFARHQFLLGLATYIGADVVRLALVAFLFKACRDKLLSIGWFAWCYTWFVWGHEWAHRQVAPVVAAVRAWLQRAGLIGGERGMWTRVRALWRYCRSRAAARP
jgi:hypothetical protein